MLEAVEGTVPVRAYADKKQDAVLESEEAPFKLNPPSAKVKQGLLDVYVSPPIWRQSKTSDNFRLERSSSEAMTIR